MEYHTVDSVKKLVSHLRNIDRSSEESFHNICDLLFHRFPTIPVLTTTLSPDNLNPLFRSRVHKPNEGKYQTTYDFSYNKNPDEIKYYGRCNKPGQQILYCSGDSKTSFMETLNSVDDPQDVETLSVGTWQLKADITVAIICQPYLNKRYDIYDDVYGEIIDRIIERDCKEHCDIIRYLLFFMYIEFSYLIGNHIHYQICAAISTLLFDKVDAIIFPSVPFMGKGFNIAFKSEVVTKGEIELIHAETCQFKRRSILKLDQLGMFIQALQIDSINNIIHWE